MKESNRRKFIDKLLSDYNRSIKKSYDKRKSGSSSSGVPQLGAQQKKSIEPLVVLNQEHQGFPGFLQSTKLTTDQITGASNQDLDPLKEYPIAPVVRWKYKEGTSLVPPRCCGLASNTNTKATWLVHEDDERLQLHAGRKDWRWRFLSRRGHHMAWLGRSVPTIPLGHPRHLYRHFVASVSIFVKSCSLA